SMRGLAPWWTPALRKRARIVDRPSGGMDNRMIFLTRFDGTEVVVNSDLIVTVERTPDTVVTLTTGAHIMVKESIEEVVARAAEYRHRVFQGPGVRADAHDLAVGLGGGGGGVVGSGGGAVAGGSGAHGAASAVGSGSHGS